MYYIFNPFQKHKGNGQNRISNSWVSLEIKGENKNTKKGLLCEKAMQRLEVIRIDDIPLLYAPIEELGLQNTPVMSNVPAQLLRLLK